MWLNNVKNALLQLGIDLYLGIDRLLNALAGGAWQATISGRIGYFSNKKNNAFWNSLRWIVDATFYLYEGPGHCKNAVLFDKYTGHLPRDAYRRSSDLALFGLLLFTVVGCVLSFPIVAIASFFKDKK